MSSPADLTDSALDSDAAVRACARPGCLEPPISRCSRCRRVGYCGPACQRAHWPAHKAECARVAAELAAVGNAVVPVKRPGEAAREARAAAEWAEVDFLRASEAAFLASAAGTAAGPTLRKAHLLAASGITRAQYNVGVSLHNAGQHALAAAWWRRAAEAGEAAAQYNLGLLYDTGNGVARDYAAAAGWFAKSAAQGFASGQVALGLCFENGSGVACDLEAATKWYTKAALQGDANAQSNLGINYQHGIGVERDPKAAAEWYTKAAQQGNAVAQHNLGACYERGMGVTRDAAAAVAWVTKAAEQGFAMAQHSLGCMYNARSGAPDKARAASWFAKAAAQGHEEAAEELARLRTEGAPPPAPL